ncbi:M23 family metallopeptidase [Aquimarina brevivitae]|uniref:Peptidase M23-like protein n=1 Tax=Aquimarina brevivitae TaxID=323412 RepID=A0A4Q7NTK2_9FLAO|nr:M23 family metallopeptidase [Aquimarina brevivitae]RZS90447.1 peptidase M23-like protein [Aquimarina brevivitae]
MQKVYCILFLCCSLLTNGQELQGNTPILPPIDIPLAISGTFGELRSNHFHSGLDIKTNGEEGLPVYAASQGTVVRIKVSHFGYGKALYIAHPNGYTTVYAHLKKFAPKIEAYVKKRQYAKESYEIQLYPRSGELTVDQKELIAYSGNTGGSGGPHLHFEVRDSNSRPLNPLNHGITIKDTKKPILNDIWVYSFGKESHVNGSQNPAQLRIITQNDGSLKAEKINAFGTIGIGVSAIDKQNLANNKNGVYSFTTKVNGSPISVIEMDRFSFSETRYLNRLIDYGYYKKNRNRIEKLFREENNPLSVFKNTVNNGFITINDSLSYSITVSLKDANGNNTTLEIPVAGKRMESIEKSEVKKTPYLAKHDDSFVYSSGNFNLYIPKGALYEDEYLSIETNGDTIKVHEETTPLHKNMTLVADISSYKPEDQQQLYLGRLNYNNEPYFSSAEKKGNKLSTRTRNFGSYAIFSDKNKPTIVPINVAEGRWISNEAFLKIKINDEETGVDNYRATINGKFILMEYDYKTGMLIYDFSDAIIAESEHNLKLKVMDKVGNSTELNLTFYRKP